MGELYPCLSYFLGLFFRVVQAGSLSLVNWYITTANPDVDSNPAGAPASQAGMPGRAASAVPYADIHFPGNQPALVFRTGLRKYSSRKLKVKESRKLVAIPWE